MISTHLGRVLRDLSQLSETNGGAVRDEQLLERFIADRDEAAFTALVQRHGPMVLGVCRSVLHHEHDAEDAFQAAFLTLVRKAASIRRRASLASWLYGVAYHLAVKAQARAARRRQVEQRTPEMPATDPLLQMTLEELRHALHEELQRLPEKYRAALVLCYLEGKSHDEAAHLLGWSRRRVKGRLQRGREHLRRRLARRGLALAALAVPSAAALPVPLLATTVRSALAYSSGAATAAVPRQVAALMFGARNTLGTTPCKILAALMLAAGLLAAGVLAQARQPPPEKPTAREQSAAPKRARTLAPESALVERAERVTVSSRVLDPDGKPFAGAEVTVWWYSNDAGWSMWQHPGMHDRKPRFGATSGSDGRFRFTFTPSEITHTVNNSRARPWRRATLVAAAKGYGPAWVDLADLGRGTVTLRLVKDDIPIRGRILDLQGRPVAGSSVQVVRLKAVQEDRGWLNQDTWAGLPRGVTTDKDGRFVLSGIGRDRVAVLQISGPAIETRVVDVPTRSVVDGKSAKDAKLELIVGPTKGIEGTVRARDTGKPLAGVWVYGNEHAYCNSVGVRAVRTRTDGQGRYRLVGLPKAARYALSVYPAEGQPYLRALSAVPDSEGLKPLTADFRLYRGVPVRFRLIDKETGKSVPGSVQYEVAQENPLRAEADLAPGVIPSWEFMRNRSTDPNGFIHFVAFPGPGVIFAHSGAGNSPYLMARLDPADAARGHYPLAKGDPSNGFLDLHNGYHRIEPDVKKDKLLTFDIVFTHGRELRGTLLAPDGKPVTGATAYGTTFDAATVRPDMLRSTPLVPEVLKTASFRAHGLYPGEARTLSFVHKQRKLIAHVVVKGTEAGALTVRLQPWAAVAGRLVVDGKPLVGVRVRLSSHPLPRPGMLPAQQDVVTDAGGRFRVDGLLPGRKHALTLNSDKKDVTLDTGTALQDLTAAAGEIKDLGDVKVTVAARAKKAGGGE